MGLILAKKVFNKIGKEGVTGEVRLHMYGTYQLFASAVAMLTRLVVGAIKANAS